LHNSPELQCRRPSFRRASRDRRHRVLSNDLFILCQAGRYLRSYPFSARHIVRMAKVMERRA
jgi:hypothetical protein